MVLPSLPFTVQLHLVQKVSPGQYSPFIRNKLPFLFFLSLFLPFFGRGWDYFLFCDSPWQALIFFLDGFGPFEKRSIPTSFFSYKKLGDGDMVQRIRALAALAEDLGFSYQGPHCVSEPPVTPVPGDVLLATF